MIINGVDAGKRLYVGKFDLSEVWTRRSVELNDQDSTKQKGYSDNRNANFIFLLAYDPDKTNENQLLFEMAKYNFTSYMARFFDINIEEIEGLHRMQISGFNNYDEARQYANAVYQQASIKRLLDKVHVYVISEENLKLLGTSHTYEEYKSSTQNISPLWKSASSHCSPNLYSLLLQRKRRPKRHHQKRRQKKHQRQRLQQRSILWRFLLLLLLRKNWKPMKKS